jgi:hypothetical protein
MEVEEPLIVTAVTVSRISQFRNKRRKKEINDSPIQHAEARIFHPDIVEFQVQ